DRKGETIFRPRGFFYVLERITCDRLQLGLMRDDIPEQLLASGTCVATAHFAGFPWRTREFLTANFLRVGQVSVAGQWLAPDPAGSYAFDLIVPANYAIVAGPQRISGTIDGVPMGASKHLNAGHHVFRPDVPISAGAVGQTIHSKP